MRSLVDDWEYNVLGVYNYHQPGPYEKYFEFIIENHKILDGDICEAGVFRGRTLLGTAMLLKELGSTKKVWGFDSFAGFPIYHENDHLDKFNELHASGQIDDELYRKVQLNLEYRALNVQQELNAANISSSGDFSNTSLGVLKKKMEYLELDNIQLVKGSFDDTMNSSSDVEYYKFCAALLDCDLYSSYRTALPFIWERLERGGYAFLDEYYSLKFPGARIAINGFFADKLDKPQKHPQKERGFERWFVRKIFSN
jgi:hypothetical protein